MHCRIITLSLIALLLGSCAWIEGPRWALIGDTEKEGYFLDRQSVERVTHSLYRYPVKIIPYHPEDAHHLKEEVSTYKVLFQEMDCQSGKIRLISTGVVAPSGKILFRRSALDDSFRPIPAQSMDKTTYDYLCRSQSISAVHNH